MTDNEIIKDLERYISEITELGGGSFSGAIFAKEILDLINRLKAENEELKKLLESRHKVIEFLEGQLIGLPDEVRAEAVKEFAERLKEKSWVMSNYDETGGCYPIQVVTVESIDNLLKEMG